MRIYIILFFLCLSGCAIAPYVPPQKGETSAIDFSVGSIYGDGIALAFFEGDTCTKPKMIADNAKTPHQLTKIANDVKIPANQTVTLMAAYIWSSAYSQTACVIPFSFYSSVGSKYKIHFEVGSDSCGVILKKENNGNLEIEPTFTTLKYTKPNTIADSFCKP